jgi:hypothetical protein
MSKPIKNISEFLEQLKELQKNKDVEFFYRGESQDFGETKNTPSIYRDKKLIEKEHELFRDFILRNPDEFKNEKTTFQKLVKMQHYGLPTRLLDVTSNALISLYFAVENSFEKDGIVYIFEVPKEEIKFYDSDTVSVLANLSKIKIENFRGTTHEILEIQHKKFIEDTKTFNILSLNTEIKKKIKPDNNEKSSALELFLYYNGKEESIDDKMNGTDLFQELIIEISKEKPYFKPKIKHKDLHKTILVKPLLSNRRIIMQSGLFLIFGTSYTDKWKYKPSKIGFETHKIQIDAYSKEDILKELETLGISKDRIYPEMEKVAEYLKDKVLK